MPLLRNFDGLVARHFTAARYSSFSGSPSVRHSRRATGRWQVHEGPFEAKGIIACCDKCLASKKSSRVEKMEERKKMVSRSIEQRLVR